MRLITFTNLYPDADLPRHGIFIRERLRHLVATGEVTARVVALRPGLGTRVAARAAGDAAGEISVRYCPVPAVPLLSNWVDPVTWAWSAAPAVREAIGPDRDDTILDGHFLYPDGVAAVLLGRRLGVPVVLSARGSDVNVKCRNAVMRSWVRWAVERAAAVIAVSQALADTLETLTIRPRRLEVIRNGVDHDRFDLRDRATCRARLGVDSPALVSVGHLVPEKGHAIAIEALQHLTDRTLLVVGDGPERRNLEKLAERTGVAGRVRFLGLVPHADMPDVYAAADALVLPSLREGMPNVMLESLACGTPVVATDVGGIGEVIDSPIAGELMRDRSAPAMLDALERLAARRPTPEAVREYSRAFGWPPLIRRQVDLYRSVLDDLRNEGSEPIGASRP